jgi:hypothetical protein
MEQRMAVTQNELYCALGQVSDLEHSNKSLTNEVKYFKAEADKSNDLLTTRTERFAAFRVRKEQEIKNAKQAAAKRILALEKRHKMAITRMESSIFRKDRSHNKVVVGLESALDSLKDAHE